MSGPANHVMANPLIGIEVPSSDPLSTQIYHSLKDSTFDKQREFLPRDCLERLVTQDTIKKELELDDVERAEKIWLCETCQVELVQWIQSKARIVFAITIYCDYSAEVTIRLMHRFQELEFDDTRLPVKNPKAVADSTESEAQEPEYFDPKFWTPPKRYNFYQKQWLCLVPVFKSCQYNYDLETGRVFPFFSDGRKPKEGAFSWVHKVEIHSAHQDYPGLNYVAIKEFKNKSGEDTETDQAWELEARALESINKLDHPHITKCIGAIRRGDRRYFMFPWADGDNLREFWESVPQQHPNETLIVETLWQLRGIADAIYELHNFKGEDTKSQVTLDSPALAVPRVSDPKNEVSDYNDTTESIRHGDLKPDNLLRFLDRKSTLGTLKLADMGLAKRHVVATILREKPTSTRYGTIRYEAPEAVTNVGGGRSRLYDIWSMGCITFEFIIWNLYGNAALNAFHTQLNADSLQGCQYFKLQANSMPRQAEVHPVVRQWIYYLRNNDPECAGGQESAIADLLHIVHTQLLVVPLPPDRQSSLHGGRPLAMPALGESRASYRATASEFRDSLDNILKKVDKPGYLVSGKSRHNFRLPQPKAATHLSPDVALVDNIKGLKVEDLGTEAENGITGSRIRAPIPPSSLLQPQSVSASSPLRLTTSQRIRNYTLPPLDGWNFPVDNTFARTVLASIGLQAMKPRSIKAITLCDRCMGLNFWSGGFSFEDTVTDLEERAKKCDFCKMVHDICVKSSTKKVPKVRVERKQSTLMMAEGDPLPVFSIFRSPELELPLPIQLGFPELPQPGTDTFFQVVKLWLEDCDSDNTSHKSCHEPGSTKLPTRLIDVGTQAIPTLRLIETLETKIQDNRYIALSHPWGDPKKHAPFSTLRYEDNGEDRTLKRFKQSIPFDQLPATFKDAITTTRALNIRYLWIDSLCIIQGKDGDFNEESKRMEDVFSGAYCVIAASRASGQYDGFLGPRQPRKYLTFQRENESPFYICEPIDDFSRDVLEGSLNQRGWVLQERALARRTIYFTETQTYFECGNGVRCETLAKMHNNMADFLGDPNFPANAMRATSHGLKIRYFQGLYQDYSRLAFTRDEDRPIAIAGLEKRLQKAYNTKGGHGIFDDGLDGGLFHRSLLWCRGDDEEALRPIIFPVERRMKVPTWSWMAYQGGIRYADPPFEAALWEQTEIRPPWTRGNIESSETTDHNAELAITATVRDFDVAGRQRDEVKFVYDTERTESDGQRPQCVVVARSKEGVTNQEKQIYVLLVTATGGVSVKGEKIYKRAGAGIMLGKFIEFDNPGIPAKIV